MFNKDSISLKEQYNVTLKITDDEQKVVKHHFINDEDKEFKNISGILYSHFKLEDTNESGTLEDTIKNFIDDLESKEFYIPSELVGKDKNGLTDLGSDVGLEYYSCPLDLLLSKIKFAIKSLREEN